MGRSAATCFKIITCGSDSADRDEFEAPESKSSTDRRGWSFRKRSARHRVLSNTVISETQSGNKDSPESVGINSQTRPDSGVSGKTSTEQHNSNFPDKTYSTEPLSNVPEKTYAKEPETNIPEKPSTVECTDEKPQSTTSTDKKLVETAACEVDDNKDDVTLKEPDIIVIQAAIRCFLAQNLLLKHKNVIKLQAAVRGHVVRRHAVGTLRCVQAIAKMQSLVRARRAHCYIERDEKQEKDHQYSNMGTENSSRKPQGSYTSIEKLLSNRFARQLLESSPRTKTINIKCDPSKSDSAWIWLERWMSVSTRLSPNTEISAEQQEKEEVEHLDNHLEAVTQPETQSASTLESTGFKSSKDASSALPSGSDENLITYDADSLSFQAHRSAPPSSSTYKLEELQPQDVDEETSKDELGSFSRPSEEKTMHPEEHDSFPVKTETENEQLHSMKRIAPEQPEVKKFSFGSRKASNSVFIAAQSKFEELSSAASSGRVTSLSIQDTETESCTDTISSATNNVVKTSEISLSENSGLHSSVQLGGSECGTELSISSTLDSPDRSEVRVQELEQEAKTSMESPDTTVDHPKSNENLDIETHDQTSPRNEFPNLDSVQPGRHGSNSDSEHTGTVVAPDFPHVEQKPETNATDVQTEPGSEMGCQAYKPSPELSPRSHVTFLESQGTPSSKVSVKPKVRRETSGSNSKQHFSSAGNRSPSNPNQDAGTTSLDQLPKDHRSGKRRNSFGSAKSELVDQEPRDSSSSTSLPSYMQTTESARAKSISNSSPRSSPDVHNKDAYIKKRHSLPGSTGRQGSPRIQRSLSQAQQSAKGNGTHSPHERKWQR